jgi:uncharacterized membrane protein
MTTARDSRVDRWLAAGVVDAETAERILAFERERAGGAGRRGPVLLALAFGGILVVAGVLLFVSANWEHVSPAARTALVLASVGLFHVVGAFAAGRFEALATTMHAIGTAALGGGIFLAGQIFNLDEHWPSGLLMWAIGAWLAWALRRDWAQLVLALLLTPCWLTGEWADLAQSAKPGIPQAGWFLLALAFLTVDRDRVERSLERTLRWLGALMLVPAGLLLGVAAAWRFWEGGVRYLPPWLPPVADMSLAIGWLVALGLPLAAGALLRRRGAWVMAVAAAWALVLVNLDSMAPSRSWIYPWLGVGCVGLAAWGVRESRAPLVNFAVAGFAITILAFYFDTVLPKMDKSISLVGLGLLFLVGGYLLERVRRRMVGRMEGGAQ